MENKTPKILAVAGKGGVGKTSIAATLVRLLTESFWETPDTAYLMRWLRLTDSVLSQ